MLSTIAAVLWPDSLTIAAILCVLPSPRRQVKSVEGDCFTHTEFEGSISVAMQLHDFPFDTSDVTLTFRANQRRLRDGDLGPNFASDFRLLPQRTSTTTLPIGAPGGDPLSLHTRLGLPEWRYVAARTDYVDRRSTFDTYRIAIRITRNFTPVEGRFCGTPDFTTNAPRCCTATATARMLIAARLLRAPMTGISSTR